MNLLNLWNSGSAKNSAINVEVTLQILFKTRVIYAPVSTSKTEIFGQLNFLTSRVSNLSSVHLRCS